MVLNFRALADSVELRERFVALNRRRMEMDDALRDCSPKRGIIHAVGAARTLPVANELLDRVHSAEFDDNPITDEVYAALKREIDEMDAYIFLYPEHFYDRCECQIKRKSREP